MCARLGVLPQALAAIDLALWDLEGHRSGSPFGGCSAGKPDGSSSSTTRSRRRIARGGGRGAGGLPGRVPDPEAEGRDRRRRRRLAAVRAAAGPEVAIRLDANGAWTVEEAAASLRALSPAVSSCASSRWRA